MHNTLKGNTVLSRKQCDVLRGLAIIGIFLHNFCHWFTGGHSENEFLYYKEHGLTSWNYWTGGGIDCFAPIQFFSFFGHYGVPLFLFLSGFGLVMKYEREDAKPMKILPFLGTHWLKLFKLMSLGYILSVLVYVVWCGKTPQLWYEVLSQLMLVTNFFFYTPGGALRPVPYWFFGLMFEVYIYYRLFIYSTRDKAMWRWLMPLVFVVLAWLMMVPCENHPGGLNYLRYNATVAILPFSIGVLLARYGLPKIQKWVLAAIAIVSLPLIAIANLDFQAWLWAPVFVVAGSVAFVKLFEGCSTEKFLKPLAWMGVMSSYIFVVHSLPRLPIFQFGLLWQHEQLRYVDYAWLALYIVITMILAWLYKQYMKLLNNRKL